MKTEIDEIRDQIHELDLKLEKLDLRIVSNRLSFDTQTALLENEMSKYAFLVSEQASEIARLSERLQSVEFALKMPPVPPKQNPAPVHEDKLNPHSPPN